MLNMMGSEHNKSGYVFMAWKVFNARVFGTGLEFVGANDERFSEEPMFSLQMTYH